MASIANKIAQVRQAIFGKDVRESLASGLEAVNDEVESTTSKQEHLEDTFNQLVINAGNSNAEIVDARVDNTTGKSYGKVGDRLDEVSAHMEEKVRKGDSGVITYAMASQDFREQITGGNTAVVGVDAVLEENVTDGAITARKTNFPYAVNYKNEGFSANYASPTRTTSASSIQDRISLTYKTYTAGNYFVYINFDLTPTSLNEAFFVPCFLKSVGGSVVAHTNDANTLGKRYSQLTSVNNVVIYGNLTLTTDTLVAIGVSVSLLDTNISNQYTITPNKVYAIKVNEVDNNLIESLNEYPFGEYTPVLKFPNDFIKRSEKDTELDDYAKKSEVLINDYSVFDQAYIKNRGLVANNDHPNTSNVIAKYNFVDLGENAVTVKAKVKFIGDSNPTLLATPLGMHKVSDITTTALHINFSSTICRVQFFNRPTYANIQDVTSFSYTGVDITGATEYEIGWSLNGNILTVYLPNGTTETVTNENFPLVVGRYVCWEHYFTTSKQGNIFTQFYATGSSKPALLDNFYRFDGAIGIAPTGHIYSQFRNDDV